MKGIDISHHNNDKGKIDWEKVKAAGYEFVIIKCSQGSAYRDPFFKENKANARNVGLAIGYYHFAGNYNPATNVSTPDDPIKEANHFIESVGDIAVGEFLVLDWEVQHLDPVGWCKKFLDRVYDATDIKPLFYTNEARVKSFDWSPLVKADYGLWVAKYSKPDNGIMGASPVAGNWNFVSIWQFSSKGNVAGITGNVDLNEAYMKRDTLLRYGKQEIAVPVEVKVADLIYPIDKVYITQYFGENPSMYKAFGMNGHNGIDFRTKFWDSPLGRRYVLAAKQGKVIEIGNEGSGGYGIFVRLEHDLDGNGNEQTIYGHLKKVYVSKGDYVNQGRMIALTDNTGFSTGSHLHWGYRPRGWKKIYDNGFKGYVDQFNKIKK
jgi:GH25 family lysozyme M1 (1,4-beta-N-acetylmuramidase)